MQEVVDLLSDEVRMERQRFQPVRKITAGSIRYKGIRLTDIAGMRHCMAAKSREKLLPRQLGASHLPSP